MVVGLKRSVVTKTFTCELRELRIHDIDIMPQNTNICLIYLTSLVMKIFNYFPLNMRVTDPYVTVNIELILTMAFTFYPFLIINNGAEYQ